MITKEQRTSGPPPSGLPAGPGTEVGPPSVAVQAVRQLEEALARFVSTFRTVDLGPGELSSCLHLLGRLEKAVATAGMVTAARMVIEPGDHRRAPELRKRIVAQQCADVWGVSAAAARSALQAGIRVASGAGLEDALRRGRLSRAQVVLACQAGADQPADVLRMLASTEHVSLPNWLARRRRLQRLTPAGAQDQAKDQEDQEDQEEGQRLHPACAGPAQAGTASSLAASMAPKGVGRWAAQSWVDGHGVWHLRATGSLEDGEKVLAALEGAGYFPASSTDVDATRHGAMAERAQRHRGSPNQGPRPASTYRRVFVPWDLSWLTDQSTLSEGPYGRGDPDGAEPP
jgi:hypothetical protein